jgi:hypothetical protein
MKTKAILFLLAFVLIINSLHAQYVLTREANYPRAGETLFQEEVEYQDPGKNGKDIVWNFSRLIPVEKKNLYSASP